MTEKFVIPKIEENDDGWGPSNMPESYKDMPYQPFSKSDRLGRVADWTGAIYQDRRFMNKYQSQFGVGTGQYAYYHEEDESSFHLVDNTKLPRTMFNRRRGQGRNRRFNDRRNYQNYQNQNTYGGKGPRGRDANRQQKKKMNNYGPRNDQKPQMPMKQREASVPVGKDWEVLETMDFPRLHKLNLPSVSPPVDMKICGSLEYYDRNYDRVGPKHEKKLLRVNRIIHQVTTTDDPVIRLLAMNGEGNVFATDAILSTLMCSTRSVYSWDVIVQRVGDKLFFDKRDRSDLNMMSVSETANEPPIEDEKNTINNPKTLAMEATFINHNFSQQVLKMNEEKHTYDEKNPFVQGDEEEEIASKAYRYRKWDLGDGITLVARCELDAAATGPYNETQLICIRALNEWDSKHSSSGVDWRSKLETQRGAVIASEMKNNGCKLAKWTVSALLAGADQIKFGYVSRINFRDSAHHVILGVQQFKPSEFATQITLNMDNAWGILRCLIDCCMKQPDGKYLILKDPNKPTMRLYKLPENALDSDEEGSSEDDDDEGKE